MKGKDLSDAKNYKRPDAEDIMKSKDEIFSFMQIDVDYYTIQK